MPALLVALKDKDANVRSSAATGLGQVGPAAKVAVPALTEALKDEEEEVRDSAQAALKKIKAEE